MINSSEGPEAGSIDFQESDVLIGITTLCLSDNDKKPRQFGFTVMRNGQMHRYPPIGHNFNLV